MVAELNSKLHSPEGGATRILLWLNLQQNILEKMREDWLFCIDRDNSFTTEADEGVYDLPADWDHFLAVWNVTEDEQMHPKSLSWYRQYDPDLSITGSPDYYILLGPKPDATDDVKQIRLADIPDDEYVIGHDYYKKLPNLETSLDVPSLIPDHDLLMKMVEIVGRRDNEEPEDGQVIQDLKTEIRDQIVLLKRHNTLRPDQDKRMKPNHRITFEGFKYN